MQRESDRFKVIFTIVALQLTHKIVSKKLALPEFEPTIPAVASYLMNYSILIHMPCHIELNH